MERELTTVTEEIVHVYDPKPPEGQEIIIYGQRSFGYEVLSVAKGIIGMIRTWAEVIGDEFVEWMTSDSLLNVLVLQSLLLLGIFFIFKST